MSKLRPECVTGKDTPISRETALFLIRDSVLRRRVLIHGRLHDGLGRHCAMGCFWEDNPDVVVPTSLVDEVAAVNDSLGPKATAKQRWRKVNEWLRFKVKSIATGKSHDA